MLHVTLPLSLSLYLSLSLSHTHTHTRNHTLTHPQSMLFAVGLGATTALPLSGAINWVMKDGLGQLGGMAVAAIKGECMRVIV
jgi:hypothetical protein